MKKLLEVNSFLRNDRGTWLTVAVILSFSALGVKAATLTESAAPPPGAFLASQLTDLGPGTQDGARDYANNKGPPGETFTVASGGKMDTLTVKGRGDSASGYSGGPLAMTGTETWGVQIGSVNADGSIFVLDSETVTGVPLPANIADYLTFTLANPVALSAGATYEWSIDIGNAADTAWFGLAHSTGNAYANGTAFNNNTSTANPGGPNNNLPNTTFGGFVAPNASNYDYVFAIQVPEPTTLALVGLGGLGLIAASKRRRA